MRKKTRKYGKTTKQWDNLYSRYKNELKGEHNITRMNKSEFIQTYINKDKKTSVSDIARKTRVEDKYTQYERLYGRAERRGIGLGAKLSERTFEQKLRQYDNIKNLLGKQQFISNKQAKIWSEHAKQVGFKLSELDFLRENENSSKFWQYIDAHGGWDEVFEYGS